MRKFFMITLLSLVLAASGCGVSGDAAKTGDRNVLPSSRQPTIPGSPGPLPQPPTSASFKLPEAGYPWTLSYRQNEIDGSNAAVRPVIARNDIAVLTRTQTLQEDLQSLVTANAAQVRILRLIADARPKGDRRVYPGHWLLYNGTTVTSDMVAVDGVALVGVTDTTVFSSLNGDYGADDVIIYALGPDDKPDWSKTEEATVIRVDARNKTVTIRRAQYGTRAHEFDAGRSVMAVHAPRTKDDSMWLVNLSRVSPTGPNGKGAESMARLIVEDIRAFRWDISGIYLDQLPFEVYRGSSNLRRGPDVDNDRKVDFGYTTSPDTGTMSSWGLGTLDLLRYLRDGTKDSEGLGKNTGIWVSTDPGSPTRAVPFINGVALEDADSALAAAFSGTRECFEYVTANAGVSPRLSWAMVRTPTQAFSRKDKKAPQSNSPYRLGLGMALVQASASGYSSSATGNSLAQGFDKSYYLDEYNAGKEARPHFLGPALGPSVPLSGTLAKDDLFAGTQKSAGSYSVSRGDATVILSSQARQSSAAIEVQSTTQSTIDTSGSLDLKPDSAYSVVFWSRARNNYSMVDSGYAGVPSVLTVSVSGSKLPAQSVYATSEWSQHTITFYTGKTPVKNARISIRTHDPGVFWISDMELREGTSDIRYRIFGGGLVITNGTHSNIDVDVDQMTPGMKFHFIDGTQDSQVNNGRQTGATLTVPAMDSRVLVK
jgi:hypothetical protein